jgi:ribosomal protein S15P/S13E
MRNKKSKLNRLVALTDKQLVEKIDGLTLHINKHPNDTYTKRCLTKLTTVANVLVQGRR